MITQFITQLNYAIHYAIKFKYAIKLRRITRVRNFVNYAEILPNSAMGNLLMLPRQPASLTSSRTRAEPKAGPGRLDSEVPLAIKLTDSPEQGFQGAT